MRVTVYMDRKAGEDLKIEVMEEGGWKQVIPPPARPVKAPKELSTGKSPATAEKKVAKRPAPAVEKKPLAKKPTPTVKKAPPEAKKPEVKKPAPAAKKASTPRPVKAKKELSTGKTPAPSEKKVAKKLALAVEKKSGEDLKEDVELGVWKDISPELKKRKLREAREKALLKGLVKAVPVGSPFKAPTRPSSGKIEYGYIYTAGIPWANYTIDGVMRKDNTPIQDLGLRAGKHRFKYENPKLGVTKEFEIEIIKDRTIRVNIFMEKEPGKDVKVKFIYE